MDGTFNFYAGNGTIKVDTITVGSNGVVKICNPVTFTGLSANHLALVNVSGFLKLDDLTTHNLESLETSGISVLNLDELFLRGNGRVYLGHASIGEGLQKLTLEDSGTVLEYLPDGQEYLVLETSIAGRMTSYYAMVSTIYEGTW